MTYINESLEELRHVRWPTRQQAVRLAAIVLGFTFLCAFAFGALDFALSEIIQAIVTLAV